MELLDQLLFGYRNGQELIASSRPLSAAQERQVLPHMDASFERNDERQLVGTSVPSLDGYLLTRIWPAPERPRPGAVWAHGLLLTSEQLRRGRLDGLLGLLRRPANESLAGYDQKLRWPPRSESQALPRPLARALTWAALGANPEEPRVVLWHAVGDAEVALLALLDAVPAAARRELSFRTRERARLGASPYWLQVASVLAGRSVTTTGLVIDARRAPTAELPAWTSLLDDTETGAERRGFLRRYGDEYTSERHQAIALLAIAARLDRGGESAAVVAELVEAFPQAHEVRDLRSDLLGSPEAVAGLWRIGEEERLTLLVEHSAHFDARQLDVKRRLVRLWRANESGAVRLIDHALQSDLSDRWREALIDAVVDAAGPETVSVLATSEPLLQAVLDRRPEMLAEVAIWQVLPNGLASSVLSRYGSRLPPRALVTALLDTPALLALAVDNVPVEFDEAIRSALRGCAAPALEALAALPHFVRWIGDAALTTAEATQLLELLPLDRLEDRPARGWWLAAGDLRALPAGKPAVALLAIALADLTPDGDRLLELTFAPVHKALAEARVDDEWWALLDGRLPRHDDWDRAGRLRRVLVKRATAGHWDAERLNATLVDAGPHGARVTDIVGGKHPLRQVLDAALDGIADIFR